MTAAWEVQEVWCTRNEGIAQDRKRTSVRRAPRNFAGITGDSDDWLRKMVERNAPGVVEGNDLSVRLGSL